MLLELSPRIVSMGACRSANHWSRVAQASGRDVRLNSEVYFKPCVKYHKNDALDAETIVKAAARPPMRTVPVKNENQQAQAVLLGTRKKFVRQRTQLINIFRVHLADYETVLPQQHLNGRLFAERCRAEFGGAPEAVISMMEDYLRQIEALDREVVDLISESRKAYCATLTRGGRKLRQGLGRGHR